MKTIQQQSYHLKLNQFNAEQIVQTETLETQPNESVRKFTNNSNFKQNSIDNIDVFQYSQDLKQLSSVIQFKQQLSKEKSHYSNQNRNDQRRSSVLFNKSLNLPKKTSRKLKSFKTNTYISHLLSSMNLQRTDSDRLIQNADVKQYSDKIDRIDRVKGFKIKYPFLIIPLESTFKLVWDIFMIIVILWVALYQPWEMAFPQDSIEFQSDVINYIFIIDIIISLRTTYYNEDKDEIVSGIRCAYNYIKSPYFVMDVISAIPIDLLAQIEFLSSSQAQKMLKFIKIIRLVRLGKVMKLFQNENMRFAGHMAKHFIQFLMILHWFTLLWYSLVISQSDYQNKDVQNSWFPTNYRIITQSSQLNSDNLAIQFYDLQLFSKWDIYIYTFYSMLMIILGGELTPLTLEQSFVGSAIAFSGQLTIAIIFANMNILIFKQNQMQDIYQLYLDNLEHKLKEINLPENTQKKAIEYFDYCWRKKIIFDKEIQDFTDLNKPLQQECLAFIHQDIVSNVPLFQELLYSEVFAIIQNLHTYVFMPNEIIIDFGELANEMFFINEGIVLISQKQFQNKKYESTLMQGDHFNEMAIFNYHSSDIKATSITFSIISSLSRKDFANIQKEFPDIDTRLEKGFRQYKEEFQEDIIQMFKKIDVFQDLDESDLEVLYLMFFQDVFIDSNQVIILKNQLPNAFYLILKGQVNLYNEIIDQSIIDYKTSNIVQQSLDDIIYNYTMEENEEEIFNKEVKAKLQLFGTLQEGSYFGGLMPHHYQKYDHINSQREQQQQSQNIEKNLQYMTSQQFFISKTPCHLSVITANIMDQLYQKNYDLYKKMKNIFDNQKSIYDNNFLHIYKINDSNNQQVDKLQAPTLLNDIKMMQKQQEEDIKRLKRRIKNLISSFGQQQQILETLDLKLETITPFK